MTRSLFRFAAVVLSAKTDLAPMYLADDFVVQFEVPSPVAGATCQVELRLAATPTGTRLAEIVSKSRGPLLARLAADTGMKAHQSRIRWLMANFKAHIEADLPADYRSNI